MQALHTLKRWLRDLGDLAFLDTGAIDDGDKFPQRLLDGSTPALSSSSRDSAGTGGSAAPVTLSTGRTWMRI
jgi:hypothetical protein